MNDLTASGDSSLGNRTAPSKPTAKKKRNLPGTPDPDAEVIALSPKSLLATNRFVCEICNKGFQRDQNLQLHRRGHNLPWKLRQRSIKDVKKRVYVCPEPSCIHHRPSRALGDLTGIKKHFCRKHGEKKWKCEKCLKKYAVRSDWKAHSKICGTKEYKCNCGAVFNRKDNFITHRGFCDALTEESSKAQPATVAPSADEDPKIASVLSPPSPATSPPLPLQTPAAPAPEDSSPVDVGSSDLPDKISVPELVESANANPTSTQILEETPVVTNLAASSCSSNCFSINGSSSSNGFSSLFASSKSSGSLQSQTTGFTGLFRATAHPDHMPDVAPASSSEPIALGLAVNHRSSIFGTAGQERRQYPPAPPPALSATALLQKAAQMGAAASNASFLSGLGVVSSSSFPNVTPQQFQSDGSLLGSGIGLGLACDSGSGLKKLMLGTQSVFGPKHTTLDLLGLGMAVSGGSIGGLSALMSSLSGSLDVATSTQFDGRESGGREIR